MMTASPRTATSPKTFVRRMQHFWRTLFGPGDLWTLFIVGILLAMPALALESANVPISIRIVLPVVLLSVVISFLLARSHYNEFLALLIGLLYGGCFTLIIAGTVTTGGIPVVVNRTIQWFIDAFGGGINQDQLVFTLLMSGLFWFLGYNTVWHVFRVDHVWRAILPPGIVLAANSLLDNNSSSSLDIHLLLFVFMALLLTVRSTLEQREWEWYVNGVQVPRNLRRHFMRFGLLLALVAMLVAWMIPSSDLQDRLDNFQRFLQSESLAQLSEMLNRIFAPIDSQGPPTTDYYGSETLNLGGAIELGDQVVMMVDAPTGYQYYWKSRTFDYYNDGQWQPVATYRVPDVEAPLDVSLGTDVLGNSRVQIVQEFTVGLSASRLIYAAPQTIQVSLPGRMDVSYTDVAETSMNVSVIRPLEPIQRGERYTAVSMMSVATAYELRAASTNYPEWVSNTYLIIPPSITERTIQLAAEIVRQAGATNPYDIAKAIETWLRRNIAYNENIPAPPAGWDAVDWVLFERQEGYCVYYASAMIMMLRSQGIPARMAAGFAQGEYDPTTGQYVVRERDAHTWVEAYFPGYGWIEFEPTSARSTINREGDLEEPAFQNQSPPASPTPLPTNTPQPTPTPPPPSPAPNELPPDVLPTLTPTYTPTPTATPVIIPTVPPPIEPETTGSFLDFILPAFGLALLLFLAVLLLIVLIIMLYWWWEWRGMGGLSPVARAYARLERYIALIGLRPRPQQTPLEKRQAIVERVPTAERPVTAITRMYIHERYGPSTELDAERAARTADRAWPEARKNILQRWLARLLPWKR